jgi:hypothetical protein
MLRQDQARLEASRAAGDTRQAELLEGAFYRQASQVRAAADAYRERVDQYVDRQVQIFSAIAAIAVAVIITVATMGTAAPAVVALAASVAGTVATIATKQYYLGAAYSRNQLTNDVIVGAVDAVVSVLTARLGDIILKVPKATGVGRSAIKESMKQIAAQRAAKPVLHRIGATAAEQIVQAAPTAVVSSALDRNNWRGDIFKNMTIGTLAQIGTGLAVGAVVGKVIEHGPTLVFKAGDALRTALGPREVPPSLVHGGRGLVEAGRVAPERLGAPGPASDRTAAFHAYQERFPDATMGDFMRAVDDGTAPARATPEQAARFEQSMREHVLSGLPAGDRARFADIPITVLPDAEFTARTGSTARGKAAVMIIDGQPHVVVREGLGVGDMWRLREEGIHLRQTLDPDNVPRFAVLDESRLGRWGELPLEERMASWRAKLELEIDAQQRMLADMQAEAAATADPVVRRNVEARMAEVRAAREQLQARAGQLDDLELGARSGRRPELPTFLDESPRLFTKEAEAIGDTPVKALRARLRSYRNQVRRLAQQGHTVLAREFREHLDRAARLIGQKRPRIDLIESIIKNVADDLPEHTKWLRPVEARAVPRFRRSLERRLAKYDRKVAKNPRAARPEYRRELVRLIDDVKGLQAAIRSGRDVNVRYSLTSLRYAANRAAAEDYAIHIDLTDSAHRSMITNDLKGRIRKLWFEGDSGKALYTMILENLEDADHLLMQQSPRQAGKPVATTAAMRRRVLEMFDNLEGPFERYLEYADAFAKALSESHKQPKFIDTWNSQGRRVRRRNPQYGWPHTPDGRAWEVDHVTELWAGGADDWSNYLALDPRLHNMKSEMLKGFREKYRDRPTGRSSEIEGPEVESGRGPSPRPGDDTEPVTDTQFEQGEVDGGLELLVEDVIPLGPTGVDMD